MHKTTITGPDGEHLADWYSHSEHKDREEIARLIGSLIKPAWKGYSLIGADHLREYAYFNHKGLAEAVMGMATFLLNYPFELHVGCPKELVFELRQTNEKVGEVWFCSYPQKQCGWLK